MQNDGLVTIDERLNYCCNIKGNSGDRSVWNGGREILKPMKLYHEKMKKILKIQTVAWNHWWIWKYDVIICC